MDYAHNYTDEQLVAIRSWRRSKTGTPIHVLPKEERDLWNATGNLPPETLRERMLPFLPEGWYILQREPFSPCPRWFHIGVRAGSMDIAHWVVHEDDSLSPEKVIEAIKVLLQGHFKTRP